MSSTRTTSIAVWKSTWYSVVASTQNASRIVCQNTTNGELRACPTEGQNQSH